MAEIVPNYRFDNRLTFRKIIVRFHFEPQIICSYLFFIRSISFAVVLCIFLLFYVVTKTENLSRIHVGYVRFGGNQRKRSRLSCYNTSSVLPSLLTYIHEIRPGKFGKQGRLPTFICLPKDDFVFEADSQFFFKLLYFFWLFLPTLAVATSICSCLTC